MGEREAEDVSSSALIQDLAKTRLDQGGPPHIRRFWALAWLPLCDGDGEGFRWSLPDAPEQGR